MFDIGFWEIALVGVVALLVLGPERLPKVARVTGMWIGKGRRFMSSVKGEIDRELKADELKRIIADQAKASDLYEITEEAREGLAQAGSTLRQTLSSPPETATTTTAVKPGPVARSAKQAAATASMDGANESDKTA